MLLAAGVFIVTPLNEGFPPGPSMAIPKALAAAVQRLLPSLLLLPNFVAVGASIPLTIGAASRPAAMEAARRPSTGAVPVKVLGLADVTGLSAKAGKFILVPVGFIIWIRFWSPGGRILSLFLRLGWLNDARTSGFSFPRSDQYHRNNRRSKRRSLKLR